MVIWVQGAAQTNQEAKKQQDSGAPQSQHGPGRGENICRHLKKDAKTQTFVLRWHRAKTYSNKKKQWYSLHFPSCLYKRLEMSSELKYQQTKSFQAE